MSKSEYMASKILTAKHYCPKSNNTFVAWSTWSPLFACGPQMLDRVQCVRGLWLCLRFRAAQHSRRCCINYHLWTCLAKKEKLATKWKVRQPTCVKTLSCSIICSNASVTASGMLRWFSEGRSLISSVFFFKVVGEHSDDIKEGFKKYPQISSPLSGRVWTVVSVVFDTIEKIGRVIFSKL